MAYENYLDIIWQPPNEFTKYVRLYELDIFAPKVVAGLYTARNAFKRIRWEGLMR